MNRKHKLFLLCIGILLALSLMISASYALYIFTIGQEGENVVESDCFKIAFNDNAPFSISDTIPLTEEEASDITPYTFTINNICNHAINYRINIETLDTTTMDLAAIRVKLDDNTSKLLGNIRDNNSNSIVNANAISSKTINLNHLEANSSRTLNLKAWIDNDATYDQSANKRFESKVVVSTTLRFDDGARLISGPLLNKTFKQLAGTTVDSSEYEKFESNKEHNRTIWRIIDEDNSGEYERLCESGYISLREGMPFETFKESENIDRATFLDSIIYEIPDANAYNETENRNIKNIMVTFSEPDANQTTKIISTDDSLDEVVAWFENDTIYIFTSADKMILNEDFSYAFAYLPELQNIDLEYFDSSNVNKMVGTFMESHVDDKDITSLNMNNVTDLSLAFSHAYVDISDYDIINMTNVTSIRGIFDNAYVLNGNFGRLNTSNVTNMAYAFKALQNSAELFNIDENNKIIPTISFDGLDTTNVTNMSYMFADNNIINSLDLSDFDTSNVIYMYGMFYQLGNVTSLDLSNFDTSNVIFMNNMFSNMSNVQVLNLSGFTTPNVEHMYGMFSDSSNLTTIYVSSDWDFSKLQPMPYSKMDNGAGFMFKNCTSIVGGAGTTYIDELFGSNEHAHIDGGTSNPGYFTLKTN